MWSPRSGRDSGGGAPRRQAVHHKPRHGRPAGSTRIVDLLEFLQAQGVTEQLLQRSPNGSSQAAAHEGPSCRPRRPRTLEGQWLRSSHEAGRRALFRAPGPARRRPRRSRPRIERAMAHKSKKTEHAGPKKGRGAFYGHKWEAKRARSEEQTSELQSHSFISY